RPTALPARGFAAYCALQSRAPRWSEQRHEAQTAAEHLVGEGGIRPTDVPEVRVRADELDEERVPEGVLQGSERLKLAVKPRLSEIRTRHVPLDAEVLPVAIGDAGTGNEPVEDPGVREPSRSPRVVAGVLQVHVHEVREVLDALRVAHAGLDIGIEDDLCGDAPSLRRLLRRVAVLLRNPLRVFQPALQLQDAEVQDRGGSNASINGLASSLTRVRAELTEQLEPQNIQRIDVERVPACSLVLPVPHVREAIQRLRLGLFLESRPLPLERVEVEAHAVVVGDLPTLNAPHGQVEQSPLADPDIEIVGRPEKATARELITERNDLRLSLHE